MVKSYIDNADDPRRSEEESCHYDLSEYHLTLMALGFMTSNASATHRFKMKLLEFLETVDERRYDSSQDIVWRISLARGIGRAVLKNNARTVTAIEHRVLEDTEWADFHASFFETYESNVGHAVGNDFLENELSDEDVKYIDSYVSTRLRFSYLWKHKALMREIADRIDSGDMGDIPTFSDKVMTVVERIVQKGRAAKAMSGHEAQDFSTGDFSFEAAVRATHAARNKPQSRVKTGVKLLNEMLGGGYEGSRVYVHFGRSGDWKSGLLCSAAFWACNPKINPSYETRDPTRRPAVLFITAENDMFETVERMVSFSLGSNVDMRGADIDRVVHGLENAFSTESCRFIFKYRPNRSCSIKDVDAMIYDLYLEGYEVVMVVMDYIKRFIASESFRDQRHLELGAIVDDMSIMAKRLNIPVVTGMQMNRGGYDKIQQALEKGDMDAVKKLGAADAGESINVYENADCVIFQSRVVSESVNRMYLSMRRAKMRGKRPSNLDFFAQPFDLDENGDTNEMRLAEDFDFPGTKCLGVKELGDGLAREFNPNADAGGQSREERSVARSGAVLNGGRRGNKAPPTRRERPPVGEDSGAARVEYEEDGGIDPVDSLGLHGL